METMTLGIDVACRAAHQGSLTDERGNFVWSARKFRTTVEDLDKLWRSLPEDVHLTVVMEPTRNAWVPLAIWFRRHGAHVVQVGSLELGCWPVCRCCTLKGSGRPRGWGQPIPCDEPRSCAPIW
jgi:hypothetical protein